MTDLALRPLSLGEILDRTFSLYRKHFLLFMGIAGVPSLLVLALQLAFYSNAAATASPFAIFTSALGILTLLASMAAGVFSQGGTVFAVSELYLGRTATIGESLRRAGRRFLPLLGAGIITLLAVGGATILLVIPGIYLICRLLVVTAVCMIEEKGPVASFSRSMSLTKGFAGRAFLILLLVIAIAIGVSLLVEIPSYVGLFASGADAAASRPWLIVNQILSTFSSVLVTPIMLIAISIHYYDLRVRKEAFDLQLMMSSGESGREPLIP